jgi:hypothetical protein
MMLCTHRASSFRFSFFSTAIRLSVPGAKGSSEAPFKLASIAEALSFCMISSFLISAILLEVNRRLDEKDEGRKDVSRTDLKIYTYPCFPLPLPGLSLAQSTEFSHPDDAPPTRSVAPITLLHPLPLEGDSKKFLGTTRNGNSSGSRGFYRRQGG